MWSNSHSDPFSTFDRGPGGMVMRLSGGPSPRIRWGERVPLHSPALGGLAIDLAEVKFAEPTLALRLAASASVHRCAEVPFLIAAPRDESVRAYLARAGLAREMGLPEPSPSDDILLPATRIQECSEVEPVGERLQEALEALVPASFDAGKEALMCAYSELCDNACTHGESEHGTFVLAQRYGPQHLVLAIGDLGKGIPDHLASAQPQLEEEHSGSRIARALEPGISGAEGTERGDGLPDILTAIGEPQLADSQLRIWSGEGRVIHRPTRNRLEGRLVAAYTPGTWAEVVVASSGNIRPSRPRGI
jgi:anti-sigma regulatory factor (Ser/Thr protein kinase)